MGKMKNIKKGMTLIELIVCLALIGIIAVTFLPMFTAGIKYIANAGNKSQTIYVSQDQTENKLLNGASTTSTDNITITFPGLTPITMSGEKITNGSIRAFIPQ